MEIVMELNGVLTRLAGTAQVRLQLHDAATVADALAALEEKLPDASERLACTVCAIGDELVARNTPLVDGMSLVLIPPVSGG